MNLGRPDTDIARSNMIAGRDLICVLLMVAGISTPAAAQPVGPSRAPLGLDVSLPAAKRMAGAREFIAAADWDAAVKSLDLLTRDFGGSLIEVAPGHHQNVRHAVAATLATLPAAGLAAYRRRIDPTMQSLYSEAVARHDRLLMQQVVREGFASSVGDDALDWLAEDALERGDCDAARIWWTALLPFPPDARQPTPAVLRYPDADRDSAAICARLILCSLLQADRGRAVQELAAFRARFGERHGALAGVSGPLTGTLSALLSDSEHWRSPNGFTAAGQPQLTSVLWSQSLIHPEQPGTPPEYVPTVWNDAVLISSPTSVRALNFATGTSRWPTGPDDDGTLEATTSLLDPLLPMIGRFCSIGQVVNGRYFTRTGPPVSVPAARSPAPPPSRLVCFDLHAEGRRVWSAASDTLVELTDGRFSGPPLVSADRLYIAVRRTAPQIEIGLACLAAETGQLQWERRLCTALEPPPTTQHRVDDDVLAVGAGLVFQVPGAGVIAAREADSGELRWAVTYAPSPTSSIGTSATGGTSPLLYHGGRLFVQAHDSDELLALDASNGRRLWSTPCPSRMRDLLGVAAGRLIAAGDHLWGFDVRDGRSWRFGYDDPEGYGFGRGAVAGDRIYWPTRDELFIVAAATGQMVDRINLTEWAGLTGGNLVIAGNRLLIASPTRLTALGP